MNLLEIILEMQRRALHIQDSPEKRTAVEAFFDEIGVTKPDGDSILECTGERGWITVMGEDLVEVVRLTATAEKPAEPKPPPRVYVYVSGGAVQGASGPAGTQFILMDEDNAACDREAQEEMDKDQKQRAEDEAAGHVVGIF